MTFQTINEGSTSVQEETSPLLVEETLSQSEELGPTDHDAKADPHGDYGQDSNEFQAFMNTIKGNIASGILGLPYGFSQSGVWGGVVGMIVVCIISVFCSKLLVDCKRRLQATDSRNFSYGEIGGKSFGKWGTWIVDAFLFITQVGFGCAYVIFVSKNMHSMEPRLSQVEWAAVFLPVFCCLNLFRTMKYLAPFSSFANIAILFGLVVMYVKSIQNIVHDGLNGSKPFIFETYPIFFGTAVYSYEGIGLVIPIESSMKRPQNYLPVLYAAMVVISFFYVSFGAIGYIGYGNDIVEIITSELPSGQPLTFAVQGALVFALIMTFPVQLFPVIGIIEEKEFIYIDKWWMSRTTQQNLMRILLAVIAVGIALAIPHFGLFIGLIGSFGSSMLAFILPTAFHLKLFWSEMGWVAKTRDFAIIAFGFLGGVLGTVLTMKELIATF